MRFRTAALVAGVLLAGGCGGGESGGDAPPGSLNALWDRPGPNIALVPGTSDFAPGDVRFSFLVVRNDGSLVERPRARVWLSRGLKERPFQRTVARLESVGVASATDPHVADHPPTIYVAHVRVDGPGRYWLLAEPIGVPIQGVATVDVKARSASPAIGDRAIPSRTPTLSSTGGDLSRLSTATEPDPALYRYSIAQSVADGVPFVVAFATPKFCTSRTCGPTVDVLSAVARRFAGSRVRFIHAEVYEGNDPRRGYNRWYREWRLPTEPWVFVVGRDGRIAAKFEASVSVRELSAAVGQVVP